MFAGLSRSLALGLISILGLLEIKLRKFLLAGRAAVGILSLLVLAFGNLKFVRREFQQRLVSRLFGSQGLGQGLGGISRFGQMVQRLLHFLLHILRERRGPRILGHFFQRLSFFQSLRLGVLNHRLILEIGFRW